MYKKIEVEFWEEKIEVTVELFNHEDEPTFSIVSATNEIDGRDVSVLGSIEILGGYTELVDVVEKKLKEDANDD